MNPAREQLEHKKRKLKERIGELTTKVKRQRLKTQAFFDDYLENFH